jgi:hypothetical protein
MTPFHQRRNNPEKEGTSMRVIDALEEFFLSMEGALSSKTVIRYRQKLESLGWSLEDYTIEDVTIRMLRL